MPEGTKQLSELERATSITPEALIYSEVEDISSETGFYTRALPLGLLADGVANEVEFASALDTASKTLIGAINELKAGGGGGGSNVTMEYNSVEGVDLTVNGFKENLALVHNVIQAEGRMNSKLSILSNRVDDNESDLSELNNELQQISNFPKIITKTGLLVNLPSVSSEPIMGYGNAIVTLYANNVCSVDFDVKIYAKDGTQTNSFAWGLNGLLLSDEYRITPSTRQGIVRYFNPDGTVDEAHEGYAGWAGASGNCWTFGRVHRIAGDTGSWPVSSIPVNERINGRVYGTWVKI